MVYDERQVAVRYVIKLASRDHISKATDESVKVDDDESYNSNDDSDDEEDMEDDNVSSDEDEDMDKEEYWYAILFQCVNNNNLL